MMLPAATTLNRCLVLIVLVMACTKSFSQKSYRFESISVEDGLSQSSITSLAQDESGYLWIGTQDGLNKYDGYTCKVYRHKSSDTTSLVTNYVTDILIDNNNIIWVATLGHLSRYEPTTDGFINYPLTAESFSGNTNAYIRNIFHSRDGSLVLSTSGGVIHFDPATEKFTIREAFRGLLHKDAHNYYETKTQGDWIFLKDLSCHRLSEQQPWTAHAMAGERSFYDVHTDKLYFYSYTSSDPEADTYLLKYETARWVQWLTLKLSGRTSELGFLADGDIWFATDEGISIYDSKGQLQSFIAAHEILTNPRNYLKAIYQTRDGVVWLGTNGYGLKKYNPLTNQFGYLGTGGNPRLRLANNYIDAIYTANDTVVYVTTPAGLDVLDLYRKTSLHVDTPVRIFKIKPDEQGNLWLLGIEDIWLLRNNALIAPQNLTKAEARSYTQLRKAFVGNGKISILENGKRTSLLKESLKFNITVLEVIGDSLWIGMEPGTTPVMLADLKTRKLVDFTLADSLKDPSGSGVKCIVRDSKKRIWIGSNGSGVSQYNPDNQSLTSFTENDGLPNNVIYGILEDDNHNLWMSTNNGLCEFNPDTRQVRNFEASDGLQSNEFNTGASFKSKSGAMYFGGVNGVTFFHPKDINTQSPIPHSVIAGYYVNNTLLTDYSDYVTVSGGKSVFKLTAGKHDFGFDFVSVGFSLPGRTKYRYMLENYDQQWHDVGNLQHINFTNIPPGQYVFRVKSSDPHGNWEHDGASIVVLVDAPFWKKPVTWLIAILILSAVAGVSYVARIASLKRNAVRLSKIVEQRTLEIQQQSKAIASQNEELLSQAAVLEEKNTELEKAKGLLEIEVKYLHQRQLLKSSIAGQEEERRRISQDLHDELGAILSISRMHLVQLQEQKSTDPLAGLQEARSLTESAIAAVRRISHQLMPPQLETFGLVKTLEAVAAQLNQAKQVSIELEADDAITRLPVPVELGLYRICMELINNTLRHAGANTIRMQLKYEQGVLLLKYEDDGKGLPTDKPFLEGLGFKNIEARINTLGGTIALFGQRKGFYALVKLPVKMSI